MSIDPRSAVALYMSIRLQAMASARFPNAQYGKWKRGLRHGDTIWAEAVGGGTNDAGQVIEVFAITIEEAKDGAGDYEGD